MRTKPKVVSILVASSLMIVSGAAALAQSSGNGGAVPANGKLTVEEIVDRAVARSEAQLEAGAEAQFEVLARTVVESFNGEGQVTGSEEALFRRYPLYGAVFEEMIESEGRPLTEKEAREEAKKREEFIREVQKRIERGQPPQPDDERRVAFNREFMSRFRPTLLGEEDVRGHRCWVIYVEPREGKLPERNRMDKALNQSTGTMWVSQEDFGVARVEFKLDKPIRYLGGLLATVRNTEGRLELERIEPGVWLPIEFELKLDLRIVFKNLRRTIRRHLSDYRRVVPT